MLSEEFLAALEQDLTVADWIRLHFYVNGKLDHLKKVTANFASAKWAVKHPEKARANNRKQYTTHCQTKPEKSRNIQS